MTDDLKKLQDAFAAESAIRADKSAKKAAMAAAMKAFEEENSQIRQGNTIETRLKEQGNKTGSLLPEILTLSYWRKTMKLSYALASGTSIAVLTLAIVNTGQFKELLYPATDNGNGKIVSTRSPADKIKKKIDGRDRLAMTRPGMETDAMAERQPDAPVAQPKKLENKPARLQNGIVAVEKRHNPAPAFAPLAKNRRMVAKPSPFGQSVSGDLRTEPPAPPYFKQQGRDKFEEITPNSLKQTSKEPVSTFSIDVDTASYSFIRASLNRNVLPPKDAVRIEEMINYFPYDYQAAKSRKLPFKTNVTIMPTPWNTNTKLIHIGIKGYELAKQEKPRSNLVFLLDTSGSMNAPNKLPLLKNSFKLLLSTLGPDDTVSIVAYAGSAGTVLKPTRANETAKIFAALDRLRAGGSTAGGEGIRLAYQLAEANFDKQGINRVILATDGDFNVGIRDKRQLKGFVERKRKSGVFLSILGFGMENYNDALMQTLAQNGNGNASYIDNLSEARKVLVDEASSTLFTIAKDVKIQMEFNPQTVSSYRLIGYETRKLKREDFNNDKVDAGDIGAGHTVTALYEITPTAAKNKLINPLRYQKSDAQTDKTKASEYGFLRLRYKLPNEDKSHLIETPVLVDHGVSDIAGAPQESRFASAVAAFGQLLRGGKYTGSYNYDDVIKLALSAKGRDTFGYRAEFINLVRLAKSAAKMSTSGN